MSTTRDALEKIKNDTSVFITPAQTAPVLGCDPHFIRVAARSKPQLLGFPVSVIGSRTKIPRIPFVNYLEGVTVNEDDH